MNFLRRFIPFRRKEEIQEEQIEQVEPPKKKRRVEKNISQPDQQRIQAEAEIMKNEINEVFLDTINCLNYMCDEYPKIEMKNDKSYCESLETLLDKIEDIIYQIKNIEIINTLFARQIEFLFQLTNEDNESIYEYHDRLLMKIMEINSKRYSYKNVELEKLLINKKLIPLRQIMNFDEIETVEKWTTRKCGDIIFDSDKNDWAENSPVFGTRVLGKQHLLFVIEDTDDNKFGGYISATIHLPSRWIKDQNSFLFSLESNGRIDGMKKFHIHEEYSDFAFKMQNKQSYHNNTLFEFGDGTLIVFPKSSKNYSCLTEQPLYID